MKKFYILFFATFAGLSYGQRAVTNKHFYQFDATPENVRRELSIPNILGMNTLKCDFHIHTIFSDGQVRPDVRVAEAWQEGLDAIAITDHGTPISKYVKGDYNSSYKMAQSAAKSRGILLIPGFEYSTSKPYGHMNFLFVEDANRYEQDKTDAVEATKQAAKDGALVFYNHPGWPDRNSDMFDIQDKLIKEGVISGIEVFNHNEFYPIAVDYCKEFNLAPLGTSDIHAPSRYQNYSRPMTLVFAKDRSLDAIKEAVLARRTVAFAHNTLAGEEKYIKEIVKNSLSISNFTEDDVEMSCQITNHSSINYTLENPYRDLIILPAHSTIMFSQAKASLTDLYAVVNTFVGAEEHLVIPADFIVTEANQVSMPYIKQNVSNFDKNAELSLSCVTDDAKVYYTLDGSEPTEQSLLYTAPIKVNSSSLIKAKVFKAGMKPSRTYEKQIVLSHLHPATNVKLTKNGVNYKYYEGQFITVREVEHKGKFVEGGVVGNFDLSKAKQEDFFSFLFNGYIYAPEDGKYDFILRSDDGSRFYIDGIEVINNDGSHSATSCTGSISLKKGFHRISLDYFEDYEGEELNLWWKTPSSKNFVIIENKNLFVE